jgi:hypothetical protein
MVIAQSGADRADHRRADAADRRGRVARIREQLRSLDSSWLQSSLTLLWDTRWSLLTVLLAGFGRAASEVGAVDHRRRQHRRRHARDDDGHSRSRPARATCRSRWDSGSF